ncbi:MAG TPA: FAD-binding oxidoreductase [Actinomycetota bacterium]|nr:FAD-binding oxidoreductase [Actinomycetota bacterium]
MTERSQVVVVGGGIVGSCVAWFLAQRGAEVTVVEKDPTYERSSTSRSAAAIRQQFHLGVNVAMSRFGYEFYSALGDVDFVERGYLVLATADAVPRLEAAHRNQLDNGASVDLLDRADLRARFPWLKGDDVAAATFGTAGEGWFDPVAALAEVRAGAARLGARYLRDEVTDVDVDGGRVVSVRLRERGRIDCEHVVNAAGPGAGAVSAAVGEPVPVEPRKRTVCVFRARERIEAFPNLVDPTVAGRGLYVRPYDDLYMAVTAPPPDRDPATTDLEPDVYLFDDVIRDALARRVRGFEDAELVRAWAGHYEMNTYDQNAIVGAHPHVAGFWLACGFSGHGVMHAPAAARGIAEMITGGRYETIDLTPFSVERIARGDRLDDIQPSEVREEGAGI